MIDTVVRVRYVVPQLWVGVEVIGASFALIREGHRVQVNMPNSGEAFSSLPESISDRWMPSLVVAGPVFNEPGRDDRTAGLVIFEVTVDTVTDVSSPKPRELTDGFREIVETDLLNGRAIADAVAHDVTRHFRATVPQQTWLGLAAHRPEQYGIAALENRDTGEFIFGLGTEEKAVLRSSRSRLELEDLERIAAAVAVGDEPSIAESLLADAWHLFDADAMNDRDRAWVVAATACEVRAKAALREHVPSAQLAELDAVLGRRSNLPELLDKVWSEFLGISLRKDDCELFTKAKLLSGQRNRLVHVGRHVEDIPPMMDPALTAHLLFTWMNTSSASRSN